MEAALHGSSAYRTVRGHADYMSYRNRELDVSIWNARRLAGHKHTVYVVLLESGLLDREKRGVWVYYRARAQALASLGTLIGYPAASSA